MHDKARSCGPVGSVNSSRAQAQESYYSDLYTDSPRDYSLGLSGRTCLRRLWKPNQPKNFLSKANGLFPDELSPVSQ